MPNATAAKHRPPPRDEAIVTALPNHMENTPDLEKRLFDEELAVLEAQASIKTFIEVIAARRVKQRLRRL